MHHPLPHPRLDARLETLLSSFRLPSIRRLDPYVLPYRFGGRVAWGGRPVGWIACEAVEFVESDAFETGSYAVGRSGASG